MPPAKPPPLLLHAARGAVGRALASSLFVGILAAVAACGGGASTVAVSGTVSGLTASGLQLTDGRQTLPVPAGASSFRFPNATAGSAVNIRIAAQPPIEGDQLCSLTGGQGQAGAAMAISINCHQARWKTLRIVGSTPWPPGQATADGPATTATLGGVADLAFGPGGHLYVADAGAGRVRRVEPDGTTHAFAGAESSADVDRRMVDGSLAVARFAGPYGLASDAAGNLYVADDSAIRKITPAGQVSTLAGSATEKGFADGPAANARFNLAQGLAVDDRGDVYVADTLNYVIRKITPDGVVSTVAGSPGVSGATDGTGAGAALLYPSAIVRAPDGSFVVGDQHALRRLTPAGVVKTLVQGSATTCGADGLAGVSGTLCRLSGVAMDPHGNFYAADPGGHRVQRYGPDGRARTLFGPAGGGPELPGRVSPRGIVLAPDDSLYFSADLGPGAAIFHAVRY